MENTKKVMLNILHIQNLLSDRVNEILRPYSLSGEQYNVLRILRGQEGKAVNMNVIQERMITKSSNTTRLIDKLLAKELVTRKVCPQNRRKMEVAITAKGLDLLSELDPKMDNHENYFGSNLTSEELTQINNLLEKYRTINK